MVPVKSPGSSRRKGKEAIYDPPVKQETGEEAVYFESNHSDEEEARRDYVLPSPSRVWLAFCRRNLNVSWALVSSTIFDLVIRLGISLPVPIHFEFGLGTALGWKEWVDSELSDTGFMGLLQRAGVLKAVVLSRSLSNF